MSCRNSGWNHWFCAGLWTGLWGLCVALHSGAPDYHGDSCVRPPINFLTKVLDCACLTCSAVVYCQAWYSPASGYPPFTFCYQNRWGATDPPCWPATQGLNDESCIGPSSEIITSLCQCQGRECSNCTLPHKPTVREAVLWLMGSSPHRTQLDENGWAHANFIAQRFRGKRQRAPWNDSDCDYKTTVTISDHRHHSNV